MSDNNAPDSAEAAAPGPTRPPGEERRPPGPAFGSAGVPMERSKDFKGATRRLGVLMRPERSGVLAVMTLTTVSVVLLVLAPSRLGDATNVIVEGLITGQGIDFGAMHRILLTVLAMYAIATGLSYIQAWLLAGVVQRAMFRLRGDVEDKINRLPLSWMDSQPRGDLLSRVTNDIDNLAQSLQQTLSQILNSSMSMIGVLIMMFTIDIYLALATVVTVPLSIVTMKAITTRSKRRFVEQWKHTGALNAQVEEVFTGHSLVKVFGRQEEVEQRFNERNDQLFGAAYGAQFISGIIQPAMMFFGNLNYVAIALLGGLRVSSGQMSIGDIQAFIQYSRSFSQPLTHLASMVNVMQSGIASAERVFELLDAPEEDDTAVTDLDQTSIGGLVEFRNISFSYDPAQPLIENLSLR
ncbi:MAG: ABC transporter ATP-binding protein, partial [Acidimicrobiales bacterium]|nr:ABC transporter ATP-binding protein [Acidimicrobiales bacterium]